jgi:serine O-acetyltransferase
MVGAGAKVLGSCIIGDNSKIGAGSVVLEDVPPGSTVVGVPGRVVKRLKQNFPQEELDQIHLPDPVKEELMALQHSNKEMAERLLELEKQVKELITER